jgi:hypothetical protein
VWYGTSILQGAVASRPDFSISLFSVKIFMVCANVPYLPQILYLNAVYRPQIQEFVH